jgi:SAM-dependent methyltransferase
MKPAEWHAQYLRQADWTRPTRTILYQHANLSRATRVLDVGCGTGAITEELAASTPGEVIGVDIDTEVLAFARAQKGKADYRWGDAHALDFPDGHFDAAACHFTLLWCRDPAQAAAEMVRVTRPGGAVLVCAEPDYGGRIDFPPLPIGAWQAEALRREGADPSLGRRLRALFAPHGVDAEIGLIPGMWDLPTLRAEFDAEWALWEHSLVNLVPAAELAHVQAEDWAAIEAGIRLAFVPVFYAFGRVRSST